ncbi:MAG: hypothetical protein R3E50_13975 [Halioglobus sp.]
MFMDFLGVCFDQRFATDLQPGGEISLTCSAARRSPMVVRTMVPRARARGGAQTPQNLTQMVTMVPGLKVVCPTNAYDAKACSLPRSATTTA